MFPYFVEGSWREKWSIHIILSNHTSHAETEHVVRDQCTKTSDSMSRRKTHDGQLKGNQCPPPQQTVLKKVTWTDYRNHMQVWRSKGSRYWGSLVTGIVSSLQSQDSCNSIPGWGIITNSTSSFPLVRYHWYTIVSVVLSLFHRNWCTRVVGIHPGRRQRGIRRKHGEVRNICRPPHRVNDYTFPGCPNLKWTQHKVYV